MTLPDYIYPSEPLFDIPWLDTNMQALAPTIPYRGWGTIGRNKPFPGMYHCYVDDRYFKTLVQNPDQLLASGCKVAIEPNISSSLYTPRALFIETIYWKRWVNRVWQSLGIQTIVDVNVPSGLAEYALLGVPEDWKIYSTRGYSNAPEAAIAEYQMCRNHATQSITFVVYAGGKVIEDLCKEYGWVYLHDDTSICRGREDYPKDSRVKDMRKVSDTVTQPIGGSSGTKGITKPRTTTANKNK